MRNSLLVVLAAIGLMAPGLASAGVYCSDIYDEGFEREACVTGFMHMAAGEGEHDARKKAAELACDENETYVSACKQGVVLGSNRIRGNTAIAR